LAFEGKGEFVPGEHCRFCRAKATCKALSDFNLSLAAEAFTDPSPALISDERMSEILDNASLFKNWINAVEEYAEAEALKGKKWPHFKLVEGRSNRKYIDDIKVREALTEAGYKAEDFLNIKVVGITELTGLLGKKKFEELINPLIVKPKGAPTLVHESDKRQEWQSDNAATAFTEPIE